MNIKEKALKLHEENKGKISIEPKIRVKDKESLSLAYTPGVAEPCKEIYEDESKVYKYTSKGNMIAIVTDGTAVLGLGDIGSLAALPVMEGKAVLFKEFANIDAFPICIDSNDIDTIVSTVKNISSSFGGINLEDISAPRCFEIEQRLKNEMDIPVFHDDQHGTAIVVLSGLLNSSRLIKKSLCEYKVVINGAGAAGIAICKLLLNVGIKDVILCDRKGAIYQGREGLSETKKKMALRTNKNIEKGSLEDVIRDKDVFIGVSGASVLSGDMVKSMSEKPIIFALANPVPEIYPEEAIKNGAYIVATGRSDYPNQINNVLAFPGIFRGALDVGAKDITEDMKIEAAKAIASIIKDEELSPDYIIPDSFDNRVVKSVSQAVKRVYKSMK